MVKLKPHHDLAGMKEQFVDAESLLISKTALSAAIDLGYGKAIIVDIVQQLERGDFVKSETAHSPKNSKVWHDTYITPFDGRKLYLKFAGTILVDVMLVSFKEQRQ